MKRLLLYLQNHQTRIASLVLFIFSVGIVVYLNPREVKFKYEFQKGKPWLYDNLVAPYDFPVLKSDETIEKEKREIRDSKTIFLKKKPEVAEDALANLEENYEDKWQRATTGVSDSAAVFKTKPPKGLKDRLLNQGKSVLAGIYDQGILKPIENSDLKYGEVLMTIKGISTPVQFSDFYSITTASEKVRDAFADEEEQYRNFILPLVLEQLDYNVYLDQNTTGNYLSSQLESIVPTRGVVQQGELIIFKGNIVDDDKFAKLQSLKLSYQGSSSSRYGFFYLLAGQILQIGLLFLVLYIFLIQFRKQLMEDISKLTFILINILFIVALVRVVLNVGVEYVYLIPFTILPITLRSFFDTRLALFVNMVAILICGVMVPNSFEFIYLQFVAGVFSVVLVHNLYKRSQLFLTAAKIILVYSLSYLGMAILQEGSLDADQ